MGNEKEVPNYIKKNNLSRKRFDYPPLLIAARKGHLDILRILLNNGCQIDTVDEYNYSALHYAAEFSSVKCCLELINRGSPLDIISKKHGYSPLDLAAREGLVDIVEVLLQKGVDPINTKNKMKNTPLHMASIKGHDNVVDIFLKNKIEWSKKNLLGWTALHEAAVRGFLDCCRLLLQCEEVQVDVKNRNGATPLILASDKGYFACFDLFLSQRADVNASDNHLDTALHYASKHGHLDIVKCLLENGAVCSRNKSDLTPIHLATKEGHVDCMKLLMKFNPNFVDHQPKGNEMISLAAQQGNSDSLEYLFNLERFQNQINLRDEEGKTPLHHAIENSHESSALVILKQEETDLRITDKEGNTPLHLAAWNNLHSVCKELLKGSILPVLDKRNIFGATALHLAVFSSVECCKLLLESNAPICIKDTNDHSAFQLVFIIGNVDMLRVFLKNPKTMSALHDMDKLTGNTPLHLAAENGNVECLKLIDECLKRNSLNVLNNDGKSALDVAFEKKQDEAFRFILNMWSEHNQNSKSKNNETDNLDQLCRSLHSYMHESLENDRDIISHAILDSF